VSSAEPARSVASGSDAPAAAPDAASLTGIDLRRLPWIRPLVSDYVNHYGHVAAFYAGDPASAQAWRDVIARAHGRPRDAAAIASVLVAQQERRGAPPAAREAAARLADPDTVVVATGQQAGAFGGPLYTLLKAITAIQIARRTSAEHTTSVVPVFWVDAEDHDWQEVRNCIVLDAEFQPRTVALAPPEGAGEVPVAELKLDSRIEQSLGELAASCARTDFTEWMLASLRAAYRPGAGMAAAFAAWIESLLGPHGLVVFESADPAAKQLAGPVFVRELRSPGRTAALAAAAGEQLEARGHEPQVEPQPDSVSLFHLNGIRRAIRRHGDQFLIGDTPVSAAALVEEAETAPACFSPNVLLRPIVQDTLFPTICYVAGPSELAYLGQLGGVYEHFGIPMPLVYPRASATLVDGATARFLSRYEFPLEDLQPQGESALNRLLQSQLPPEIEQSIKDAEDAIRGALQRVIEVLPALDPTLGGAARTTLGRMEHDLRSLQSKVIQAAKRRDETLRRQFTRAQALIFPGAHPQERTLSVVFFLNRYGPALVEHLLQELPLDTGQHWVVTI
jgi:bacillithiol biosynthesis cysteine-adding enzyme BshC